VQELCAHPYLNMAGYFKARGNLNKWDLYHERGLALVKDKRWRAEIWREKADVDLSLGKRDSAAKDFIISASLYNLAGMPEKARESYEKALLLNPNKTDWEEVFPKASK